MADAFESAGLTARKIHRYGWKPSLPDLRDHVADASELKILDEVDPRADLPGVFTDMLHRTDALKTAILP